MTRALAVDDSQFTRTVVSDALEDGSRWAGLDRPERRHGVRAVHDAGGTTLAQDGANSQVFGIPERTVETGCADDVLPGDRLAEGVTDAVRRGT